MPHYTFENIKRPLRQTDTQVQRHDTRDSVVDMLLSAVRSPQAKGKEFVGYKLDVVKDGAGDKHWNVTAYFGDKGPEKNTLDPNNLNGAEQAVLGQVLDEDAAAQRGIGLNERRIRA